MIHSVIEYLRKHQSPGVRFFHITVLLLVLSQIAISNFMGFTSTGEISRNPLKFYATWTHICFGIALLPLAVIFTFLAIRERGLKHFFPYIFGDITQLKNDILKLINFKLPDPDPKGLATTIQGLGLGALFLVILSGLTWFLSWKYGAPWSHNIKELHESLVGLVELYVVGHGGMALLHIYLLSKKRG